MINFVKNKKPAEILPFGFKEAGYYNRNSKEFSDLIYISIKSRTELQILELGKDICLVFKKVS